MKNMGESLVPRKGSGILNITSKQYELIKLRIALEVGLKCIGISGEEVDLEIGIIRGE
jgi:hypothetical protein